MKATIERRNMWPPCFWQTGYTYWNTTFIIFLNLNHIGGPQKIFSLGMQLCVAVTSKSDMYLGDPSSKLFLTPGMLSQGSMVFVRPSRQIFGQSSGPQPHPVPVPSDTNQSVACRSHSVYCSCHDTQGVPCAKWTDWASRYLQEVQSDSKINTHFQKMCQSLSYMYRRTIIFLITLYI